MYFEFSEIKKSLTLYCKAKELIFFLIISLLKPILIILHIFTFQYIPIRINIFLIHKISCVTFAFTPRFSKCSGISISDNCSFIVHIFFIFWIWKTNYLKWFRITDISFFTIEIYTVFVSSISVIIFILEF